MWATTQTGWTDTTITICVAAPTAVSCTCTYWPRCGCLNWYTYSVPSEPPLLGAHRHDWWNLYHRDLRDEIRLPIAAPVSVRVARRLQPGNLHERRMQKRKRYTQRLRVQ